ncbi:MAG: prepilin-type N-terminal cleavage/methylation domain-containing protein [Candidatus Zixiibacteriota bacterium]|nr:MAG: prepilin-type N-terminal cleavage/methylation domain-containing protein [candidate division Zixibacteria bacterium]
MSIRSFQRAHGYSLFELLAVIIIIGIVAAVSMRSMRGTVEVSRVEETRQEMDQLAWAICGNPNLISGGVRTDFGYVGDVGALPASLDNLVTNPGSYANWDGPYIRDDFYASSGGAESEFKYDAWGVEYTYTGDSIISTGGGTSIAREVCYSTSDLLSNVVQALITDVNNTPPGGSAGSVTLELTYPNGAGSDTTASSSPAGNGLASFESVPVGHHQLLVIWEDDPTYDTLFRKVVVYPKDSFYTEISFSQNYW